SDGPLRGSEPMKSRALWAVLLTSSGVWPGVLRADEAENKAAEAIKSLGGALTRDEKLPGKPVVSAELTVIPRTALESVLKQLPALPHLRRLDCGSSKIKDSDLKHLAPLKALRQLVLSDTKVTDTGLKEVGRLKQLQTLDLSSTE